MVNVLGKPQQAIENEYLIYRAKINPSCYKIQKSWIEHALNIYSKKIKAKKKMDNILSQRHSAFEIITDRES